MWIIPAKDIKCEQENRCRLAFYICNMLFQIELGRIKQYIDMNNREKNISIPALMVILIFLIVCPLVMIFAKAVVTDGHLDISMAVQTLKNSSNLKMIGNMCKKTLKKLAIHHKL